MAQLPKSVRLYNTEKLLYFCEVGGKGSYRVYCEILQFMYDNGGFIDESDFHNMEEELGYDEDVISGVILYANKCELLLKSRYDSYYHRAVSALLHKESE